LIKILEQTKETGLAWQQTKIIKQCMLSSANVVLKQGLVVVVFNCGIKTALYKKHK